MNLFKEDPRLIRFLQKTKRKRKTIKGRVTKRRKPVRRKKSKSAHQQKKLEN